MKFEEWRIEMLALKLKLSEDYFNDGFNFWLDWNIQMKLKAFRNPPKILYEAYVRAKIKEAVMEKHGGKDGISMEYGCVNGGREIVEAIDDKEHQKIASSRISLLEFHYSGFWVFN